MDEGPVRQGATEGPGGTAGAFWAQRFLTMLSLPSRPPGRVRSFSLVAGRISGEVTVTGEPETATLSVDLLGPGWISLWRRALRLVPEDPLPGPDDPGTIRLARTEGISPVPARHAVLARCTCGRSAPGAWCEHVTTIALTAAGHLSLEPGRLWVLRGLGPARTGSQVAPDRAGRPPVASLAPAGPGDATTVRPSGARGTPRVAEREGPVVVAAPPSLRRLPVHHASPPTTRGEGGRPPDVRSRRKAELPLPAPPAGPALSMTDFWGRPLPEGLARPEEDPLLRPWTEEPRALVRLGPLPTARGQTASAETVLEQYRTNRDLCLVLLSPPPGRTSRRRGETGADAEEPTRRGQGRPVKGAGASADRPSNAGPA